MKFILAIMLIGLTALGCNKSRNPTDTGDPSVPYQLRFDLIEDSSSKKVSTWNATTFRASYNINFFGQKVLFIVGDSGQHRLAITVSPACQKTGQLNVALTGCCAITYNLDFENTASFADMGRVTIQRLTATEVEGTFDDVHAGAQAAQYRAKNGFFKIKIE